jgi:hypothetical protein
VAAQTAIDAAKREGKAYDPALELTVILDGQRRVRDGCFAAATTVPPPVERSRPQPLLPEDAKALAVSTAREWVSPDGKVVVIPANHALFRLCPNCPLDVTLYDPQQQRGRDIRDETIPGTTCGKHGVGWVSPWCEEVRVKWWSEQRR